jgi:hypothetical protein
MNPICKFFEIDFGKSIEEVNKEFHEAEIAEEDLLESED